MIATKLLQRFASNSAAELTAVEFLSRFRRGEITALDYVRACADRIDELNPSYSAFQVYDRAAMEERAARIDADAGSRAASAPGVPVGIKDNINTYDFPTGRGTKILAGYTPGNDARVVSNLRLEKSIVAGKTVTAEFGVHYPGATLYPYDTGRSPGTSSSGSAVAVATRMVPVALGTQTGGSIIRPASYCGVAAMKPSFGTLPRTGVLKTTDTLDTVGLLARSVPDLRLFFDIMRVSGHNYPVMERGFADPARSVKPHGTPWRVGIVVGPKADCETAILQHGLHAVISRLAERGVEAQKVRLPRDFDEAHPLHDRIYSKALSYYLREEFDWKPELFSGILREMMEEGAQISAEQYHVDTARQAELSLLLDQLIVDTGIDLLIGLSTSDEAPVGLATRDVPDHNLIWTMCGVPVVSVPLLAGNNGLPVGVCIIGRKYADYKVLQFAELMMEIANG